MIDVCENKTYFSAKDLNKIKDFQSLLSIYLYKAQIPTTDSLIGHEISGTTEWIAMKLGTHLPLDS